MSEVTPFPNKVTFRGRGGGGEARTSHMNFSCLGAEDSIQLITEHIVFLFECIVLQIREDNLCINLIQSVL